MSVFYFTFGVQYLTEPHPSGRKVDPDGWVEVEAPDEESARQCFIDTYGTAFSTDYDEARFQPHYFPHGCFARLGAVTA